MFARLTRAGFLFSLSYWKSFSEIRWDPCGVLQLARDAREEASQRASIAALALPPEYAQYVTREEASAHAGVPVAAPGLWFPAGGWIQPRSLVEAQLEACGNRLERLFFAKKSLAAAETLRWSSSRTRPTAPKLQAVPHLRLRRVRGQVTHVPADQIDAPHVVVLRGGMVLPPVDGMCVVGASFDIDDDDPAPRAESDAGNLERLEKNPSGHAQDSNGLRKPRRLPLRHAGPAAGGGQARRRSLRRVRLRLARADLGGARRGADRIASSKASRCRSRESSPTRCIRRFARARSC